MPSSNQGIIRVCMAVIAISVTVTVTVVCLRIILAPATPAEASSVTPGDTTNVAAAGEVDNKRVDNNKNQPPVKAQPPILRNRHHKAVIISVDEEEFRQAQLDEEQRKRRIREETERFIESRNDKKKARISDEIVSLSELAPEEKNKIWWEIAALSGRKNEDSVTYTLTFVQARKIGKLYQTSVLEVFRLFREGAKAEWRTPEPPTVEGEEEQEPNPNRDSWNG